MCLIGKSAQEGLRNQALFEADLHAILNRDQRVQIDPTAARLARWTYQDVHCGHCLAYKIQHGRDLVDLGLCHPGQDD
jgi:hypothetical protein